jgi:ribonucleotide reductase alpha subunit
MYYMSTFAEAFPKAVDYFKGDELAANVFLTKYALTDTKGDIVEETPRASHRRMAKEFARMDAKFKNPMSEEEIFGYMDEYKYIIAQGSPTAAIGNPYQIMSISNCFVVPDPLDSYGGILYTDQQLVQIAKRRGGVGFDISKIRPKGMVTTNAARTTDGIGIFMERFSNSCREVAQEGRRGALMLSCSVHHPEIKRFINIKKDKKKVTGANVSIRVTDEFMKAVVEDTDVQLRWPCELEPGELPVVSKMVRAREIWDEIVDAAHGHAEPGLLFWDTILRQSPADIYAKYGFKTISTNPCIRESTPLLTPDGIRPLSEIEIGSTIWSGSQWTKVTNKWATGTKPVFAFKTRAGTFYGTENHRIVQNGEKIEVNLADSIDTCQGKLASDKTLDPQDIVDGLVIGDGSYEKKVGFNTLYIGANDSSYYSSEISHLINPETVYQSDKYQHKVSTTIKSPLAKTFDRVVPDEFFYGTPEKMRGFLRGLFSANGSVVIINDPRIPNRPGVRVTLKSSSFKLVEMTQFMLSALGIASYYTTNKPTTVEFLNGEYECRQSYDLCISTPESKELFAKNIGFIQPYKNDKLSSVFPLPKSPKATKSAKTSYEIVEVEALGEEPVFDITVECDEHTYWTGGLLVSNCSELPLSIDSCRLLVTNLISFVMNPFTDKAYFDFDLFDKIVQKAQRLMDDMVELELEHILKIIAKIKSDKEPDYIKQVELETWQAFYESCEQGRRTGLGITALGDTLAALGLKYGSPAAIKMTGKIMKQNALSSYTSSIIMAKERGAFPVYNWEMESGHVFVSKIIKELPASIQVMYEEFGRRNIANNTIAPVGSQSMLAKMIGKFGVTSGVENLTFIESIRRKKRNPSDKNFRVDFVDQSGDEWQEYKVYPTGVDQWREITGKTDPAESPYAGATIKDLDWPTGVDLQAAAQEWVDHAISRTVNLPKDVSKEVVSDVYLRGWKLGIKGMTVYREGSRSGVILDASSKETKEAPKTNSKIEDRQAPKRPDVLECDIFHTSVKGAPYCVIVGKLGDRPYEVFGGHPLKDLPKSFKFGKIVKVSHGKSKPATYNLVVKNGHEETIEDINDAFDNPTWGAWTRVLSTALRHGTPVQYLSEQVMKGEKDSSMTVFSKVIARVLKTYIKDGTASAGDKTCSHCKEEALVYQEGCLSCKSCGFAKCG